MESARQLYLQQGTVATSSVQLVVERNKRHKLYNDIKFLTSRGLTFKTDEVDTSGVKVVSSEFYFHKPITVHIELYLFYHFIHFLLYIG